MTQAPFLNIDFLISVVLTIALLSTVVSWMVEWYQGWINARGKMLYHALEDALKHENADHPNYTALLYQHPLIDMLKVRTDRFPSYISPELFAQALIQVINDPIKELIFIQNPETKQTELLKKKEAGYETTKSVKTPVIRGGGYFGEGLESEAYDRLMDTVNKLKPSYLRTLLDSF